MIRQNAWNAPGLLIALLLLAGATTMGCDISPVPNPTAESDPGYGEETGGETGFETLGEEDETGVVPPGGDTGIAGSIDGGEDTNGIDLGGAEGGETGGEETGGGEGQTEDDEEGEEGEEDECEEDALETEDTEGEDCSEEEPEEEPEEDPLDE